MKPPSFDMSGFYSRQKGDILPELLENRPLLQKRLLEVLDELDRDFLRHQGPKMVGPCCRLDQETFDLLEANFKVGQYGKGIVHGFMQVKSCLSPADLKKASIAVSAQRRLKGKHVIQLSLFADEIEALKRVSKESGLKESAVLEAAAYLYFRASEQPNNTKVPSPPWTT